MFSRLWHASLLLHHIFMVHGLGFNVGSVLYATHDEPTWSNRELARLRARKIFQELLPRQPCSRMDPGYVADVVSYLNIAMKIVKGQPDSVRKSILTEALADTIGGFLRTELLPHARYSYYAGRLHYSRVREVNMFYYETMDYLNTLGKGWSPPKKMSPQYSFTAMKLDHFFISENPCETLITKRDSGGCVVVPMPILDETDSPSSIALPFKKKPLRGLSSMRSSGVLLRYYRSATQCILKESPPSCRAAALVNFNRALCRWIHKEVVPRLEDEHWYVGFGGVLRLSVTVCSYCDFEKMRLRESGIGGLGGMGGLGGLSESVRPAAVLVTTSVVPHPGQRLGPGAAGACGDAAGINEIIGKVSNFSYEKAITLVVYIMGMAIVLWLLITIISYLQNICLDRLNIFDCQSCDKKDGGGGGKSKSSGKSKKEVEMALTPTKISSRRTSRKQSSLTTQHSERPSKYPSSAARAETIFDLNEKTITKTSIPDRSREEVHEGFYVEDVRHLSISADLSSIEEMLSKAPSVPRTPSPPSLQADIIELHVKKNSRNENEIVHQSHLPVYSTSERSSESRSARHSAKTFAKETDSLSSSMSTSTTEASIATNRDKASLIQETRKASSTKRAVARIAKDLAWAKKLALRKRRSDGKQE